MASFDYHAPRSLDEAIGLLQQYGDDAHLIAGGTSVMLMWKQGLVQPGHLVALRGLEELQTISVTPDGGLTLGAGLTHRQVESSSEVERYCPALADTISRVATIRIRNQGTIGGNLAHADPAQDPPPMLLALEAEVVARGPNGERRVPLDSFFVDYFETALEPGEVLTRIDLPPLQAGTVAAYQKFLPRTADDYATVSVAGVLRLNPDGTAARVRLGLGSVGTTPIRARAVEQALEGQTLTPERIKEAAQLVLDEVDPLDDVRGSAEYKREMARVWTQRTLQQLLDRAAAAQA